ncbi:MAG: hypothetical protein JST86_01410 [Bacteroidetes bacterium]|nr:hypothetical protein [Bacteroidota bacterium]
MAMLLTAAVHAHAQNINIPNKTGPMGLQVNTLTGNLFFTRNDLYIPARHFSFNISFHYNSFNFDSNVGYGNGWNFDYNIKYANDTTGGKIITWGDGREDGYKAGANGIFIAPRGFFSTLAEYQPGKFSITETDGTKYFFDNSTNRRITRMEEPNGNYLNFSYTDTLLTALTNGAGQTISFTYTSGRLTAVTDAMATPTRTFTYVYDGAGNLKEVKDPLNNSTKYSYLVNGPIKDVTDKNNNKVDIIYFNNFSISELIGCNKRLSFSYDTATLTTLVTDYLDDGNNQVTKYEYKKQEGSTWLSGMSGNCCGFDTKFEFDNNGNKIKETDANGNITSFTYDSHGNMLTMTDALNQTVAYTYTPDFSKITSFTDENGYITTMTYDTRGNLTQITEPGNLVYTATYAANGDIITSTDPRGNTFTYNYDSYGNPLSVNGPEGFTAQLAFDTRGNLLSVTDANGNTNNIEYDILSRLKKITDPSNSNIQVSYDAEGNPVLLKNDNNETINMAYDASNRPVEITNPVGEKTKVTYDAMDNLKSVTNTIGGTFSLNYDNRNRLKKATDPSGNTLTTDYDANGNLTVLNMPNGQKVNYTYDALNRVTVVSDINGTALKLSYDKKSNITSYTNSSGAIFNVEYDNLNRVKKLTDPLGNFYAPGYDNNSNVISITDRNGYTSTYTYDSLNQVKTMTDNNGNTITTDYDAASNPVAVKDQNNNITTYTYDNLNRLKRVTYPDGKFIEYTYDNKSNIIAKKIPDGSTINFVYDTLNRVISKTLPGGEVFAYTYDSAGRIRTATNNAGTVTLTYDALSRVSSEIFAGKTVNYSYNVSGRMQTTVYPNGTTVVKSYDTRNKLISITQDNAVLVTYQYNAAGQLASKTMANGIITNYQYDFANRLINISTAGGAIQNSNFAYNNEQQKTSINRLNDPTASEQFTYDNGGRLTDYKRGIIGGLPVIQNTYGYDALGNRTTANLNGTNTTYTSNNLNQLLNSNNGTQNINFTYDNNGNLIYDGQFYKSYDAEGRLLKDSSSPANVITYQYDAFNRRVTKSLNGNALHYTFSGLTPIEERDATGNSVINKTIFAGFLKPVVNEKNNQQFFYHENEMNSVEAITNQQGRLLEKYQYDVYGKISMYDSLNNPLTGSLAGNYFGFTGQVYDSATGRYHFFFREYNPETGLFNQRDPIGYTDGMGMYQYVHNNPANGIDILGLESGQVVLDELQQMQQDRLREEDRKNPCNRIKTNLLKLVNEESTPYSLKDLLTDVKNIRGLTEQFRDLDNRTNFGALELMEETTKVPLSSLNKGLGNLLSLNTVLNDIGDFAVNGANGKSNAEVLGTVVKDFNSSVKLVNTLANASPSTVEFLASTPKVSQFLKVGGEVAGAEVLAVASILEPAITYSAEQYYSSNDGMLGLIVPKKVGDPDLRFADRQATNRSENPFFRASRDQAMVDIEKRIAEANQKKKVLSERYRREFIRRVASFLRRIGCPQNYNGGTQRPAGPVTGNGKDVEAITSNDPNAIIGPDGQPDKHWVSVKDRLPYTILFENSKTASAPAKFVRITSPIEPKEDAATFQLSNFGFNNQTFTVPNGTSSYYQRLDCRDSLGLYVDVTAGYDQVANQAFWEFQSIDPVTLLPPTNPLKGFLLLQDSTNMTSGHAFASFSMKPKTNAITLDTIGARASIVFDIHDTIPTNIATNTIDAFAPTSHITAVTSPAPNTITLNWTGTDDSGGCGIDYYTIYVSNDHINYTVFIPKISRTDTTFTLPPDTSYCFFVLATDRVGNTEVLRQGEIQCGVTAPLPVTWLFFKGSTVAKDNVLDWATASEQNTKQFDVERSLNGVTFTKIGVVNAVGNSSTVSNYQYTDYNIDRLNSTVMYYRLKQIDINGKFNYSNIVRLNYNAKQRVPTIVYPNPTQGTVTILCGDKSFVGTMAVIYDINGRVLENIKITANAQAVHLDQYVNGVYLIKLSNNEVLKVIKQ